MQMILFILIRQPLALQNSELLFDISTLEVRKAVSDAKLNKACGIDCILAEVLENDTVNSSKCLFFPGKIPFIVGAGCDKPDSQTWHHRPKRSPVISRYYTCTINV